MVPSITLTNPGTQTSYDGDAINLSLTARNSALHTLSYSEANLPAGLSVSAGTFSGGVGSAIISGTISSNADQGGPYSVTITATDTTTLTQGGQSFTWKIIQPTLTLTQPKDQTNCDGDTVSLPVAASENASHTLTYSESGLPMGLSINQSTGVISGTVGSNDELQGYSVTVTATDGAASLVASKTFNWTLVPIEAVLSNPGDQLNYDGDAVNLTIVAETSYASAGIFTFGATNLPGGLGLGSTTGVILGTIGTTADTESPYAATVSVTDSTSHLSASEAFNWNVSPISVTLYNPGSQTNCIGDSVSFALPRSDTANYALAFTATDLPDGLTIDRDTGEISGEIATDCSTSVPYSVTVNATDANGFSATQTFTWTIASITILNPGDQYNFDGDSVDLALQIEKSSASNDTLTYSETGSLPPGLALNAGSGVISGTISSGADTASPYSVAVTVTDQTAGTSASQTISWYVSSDTATVSLANPGNKSREDGQAVTIPLTGFDSLGNALTYSATGLPTGLSVVGDEITGTLASNADERSPYTITAAASDSNVNASQTFTLSVTPATPSICLTNSGEQDYTDGQSVSIALNGTDSTGDILSWNATGLPTGLSVSGDQIVGSIPALAYQNSPYVVTATATDGGVSKPETFPLFCAASASETAAVGSTTTISSSASTVNFGQAVIFSATVTGGDGGTPAGSVKFLDGGMVLGTVALNASGVATFTTSALSIGAHSISAKYNGNNNYAGSRSDAFTQNVNGGIVMGEVWVDDNANGIVDSGESGLPFVTVNLCNVRGQIVATTQTGNGGLGTYSFNFLDPNSQYYIYVQLPDAEGQNYTFTFSQVGNNPAVYSATSVGNGTTAPFQVAVGNTLTQNSGLINLNGRTTGAISGPAAVPGDSQYTYLFVTSGQQQPGWRIGVAGQNCQTASSYYSWSGMQQLYSSAANLTISAITLILANNPAVVTLYACLGSQVISTQNISVVGVVVSGLQLNGKQSFNPGTPTDVPLQNVPGQLANITVNGQAMANVQMKGVNAGSNAANPGLGWQATVTLLGPNNNQGVNMIQVGFIQNAQWNSYSGYYYAIGSLVSPLVGQSAIDIIANGTGPWYSQTAGWNGLSPSFLYPTQQASSANIGSFDTPAAALPASYLNCNLEAINYEAAFTLDVAAQTTDSSNGADLSYWGQKRANWTFNATGNVAANDVLTWTSNLAVGNPPITPPNTAPNSWNTNTPASLMPEAYSESTANQLLNQGVFNSP